MWGWEVPGLWEGWAQSGKLKSSIKDECRVFSKRFMSIFVYAQNLP